MPQFLCAVYSLTATDLSMTFYNAQYKYTLVLSKHVVKGRYSHAQEHGHQFQVLMLPRLPQLPV